MEWNRKRLIPAWLVAAALSVLLLAGRAWAVDESEPLVPVGAEVEDKAEAAADEITDVEPGLKGKVDTALEEAEADLESDVDDEFDYEFDDELDDEFDEDVVSDSEDTDYFDDFENAASLYDHRGWIFRLGALGTFLDAHSSKINFDPAVGFAFAAGVQHNDWVVTEMSFSWVFESETNDYRRLDRFATTSKKAVEEYELAIDIKLYPIGFLQPNVGQDWIQPYVTSGVGAGEVEIGDLDQSRFLIRFGAGVDVLMTDRYGFYIDGGYTVITSTARNSDGNYLDGASRIGIGALVRY